MAQDPERHTCNWNSEEETLSTASFAPALAPAELEHGEQAVSASPMKLIKQATRSVACTVLCAHFVIVTADSTINMRKETKWMQI